MKEPGIENVVPKRGKFFPETTYQLFDSIKQKLQKIAQNLTQ